MAEEKQGEKVVLIQREPTRMENIKQQVVIAMCVISGLGGYFVFHQGEKNKLEYERKLSEVKEQVDLMLVSDSVTNRNIAEAKGICSTQKIEIEQIRVVVKDQIKEEINKRRKAREIY